MNATRLPGHALLNEGRVYENGTYRVAVGSTRCSCGEESPELASDGARRRWHAGHKDEIRAQGAPTPEGDHHA